MWVCLPLMVPTKLLFSLRCPRDANAPQDFIIGQKARLGEGIMFVQREPKRNTFFLQSHIKDTPNRCCFFPFEASLSLRAHVWAAGQSRLWSFESPSRRAQLGKFSASQINSPHAGIRLGTVHHRIGVLVMGNHWLHYPKEEE